MREILFRGKLIGPSCKGKWSYGCLKIWSIDDVDIVATSPDDTVVGIYGRVNPETVGQFTGLTDRNGVKIFEGDIVRAYIISGEIVTKEVTYNEDLAAFVVGGYPLSKITALRKVGNIYDNPELLEVEK